jgi:hypothetical protein
VPTLRLATLPYVSGFEPKRGGWTVPRMSVNSTWEHGKPSDVNGNIVAAASGTNVWTTGLIGNYNNNERSYLYSPCMDMSSVPVDPEIVFSLNYNTEATYDGLRLERTIDNGATWQVVGSRTTGVNWYNDTVRALGGYGWTRNSNGWIIVKDTLRGLAGRAQSRLRLSFASDLNVNAYDGVAIDNVVIRMPVAVDLAAATAKNQVKTICGSPNDSLTMTITNLSNVRQYRYTASYQVNGGAVVTENIDSMNIQPGMSANYKFRTAFNSTADGTYNIKVWVKVAGDAAVYNDTTILIFERVPAVALPVSYNFNNYQLPMNWQLSRAASGVESAGHGNRGSNGYLYANMYSGAGQTFSATTAKLGIVRPLDSMSYDYRVVNGMVPFAGYGMLTRDTLFVEAAACGGAWVGLDTVHAGRHIVDTLYKKRMISLSRVAGGRIQIRFRRLLRGCG